MADETTRPNPAPGSPAATEPEPAEDQDYLFRAQVAGTEFILRYWKYGVYAVVGVLVAAFAWGSYDTWSTSRREEQFGAIAAVAYKMPQVDQMALYGLAPKDDPADAARTANLAEGARRFLAAAEAASGSAAVYAYLEAADAFNRAGQPAEARKALEAAVAVGAPDLAQFPADAQWATLLANEGATTESEAFLRGMASRYTGFFAQEALLRLASLQVDQGKLAEAKTTVDELYSRFASPARPEAVAALAARVGASAPAVATAPPAGG